MRNFKKVIAVVVTLVMLLGVMAIGASAAEPTLSLVGREYTGLTKGNGYYELQVVLADSAKAVGGIEGTIAYDETIFDYDSAVLGADFSAGNTVDNSIAVDETNGSIKFVGLATGDGVWFTLKFAVVAEGTATFDLTTKGANADGSAYLTVTAEDKTVEIVDAEVLNLEGATIKKTNNTAAQDIKFRAVVNNDIFAEKYAGKTVTEYGIMFMFTKRLEDRELKVEMIGDDSVVGLAVAHSTEGDVFETFAANINNMTADAIGVRISARAYAKLSDDSVIYSNNYNSTYGTKAGYESKSVIDVARSAAEVAKKNCSDKAELDAIDEILAMPSIKGEARADLLKFIVDYYVPAES